ncbi:l- -diaminobutyrate decarboxylase [Fusarium langsethiae]|uniref:L--diaminobutyrate decarboxylase n=1 Tax=Fusarium langsethiae TaxID=179993 RepID=A0A0M9ET16_FUSLA|nr:l- -diaminobutyrate decarboxylase [Fusarium langsethiae]GKU06453.1 unnamed protein product [Fusarium langsethiae]
MANVASVAPWESRADGLWTRPLTGPERMFDQWLELDGWTEWMGAVIFTVSLSRTPKVQSRDNVETWFNKAIALVCLQKPSLLATIQRGQQDSVPTKSRDFIYTPLESDNDLAERIAQRTTILHTTNSAKEGLKSLTDEFYSSPEKRISFELGSHLIHISLVVSSSEPGTFAAAIRCHHALNDFWSGVAILDNILCRLSDGLIGNSPFPSHKSASTSSLHPCYLDILQQPLGNTPMDQEAQEKAKQLLGANLANITLCPITEGSTEDFPDTKYAVRRQVYSEDSTKRIINICKARGVTVTALLTALQAFALLKTFPPQSLPCSVASPICVSNRLKHTSLSYGDASLQNSTHKVLKRAADIGPIMATTFLVSPFKVGPFLKKDHVSIGSQQWFKDVWEVTRNVSSATEGAVKSNISEHVDWTQGPAAFGGVAHAMEAMKAGHLPSSPGMYTPLSSAGLMDGTHLKGTYGKDDRGEGPALSLDDFSFYSQVSNLFGPQTWAWTALGKLNTILVMPDPRIRSVPNTQWWQLFNASIDSIANDSSEPAMDSSIFPDQAEELVAISSSFQAIFDRLLQTTQNVREGPILRLAGPTEIPRLREISIPGTAHPVRDAIEDAFTISDFRFRMNHPRTFAFIPAPVSPISWIGDCLTSAFNSFAGSALQGPGVAIIEQSLLQWLASKVGLPDTAGGIFVSGGSMANMSGMVLAREHILEEGTESLGTAYLSDQTHHSVTKALRIIGIKHSQIRFIPTNSSFQMDISALRKQIQTDRAANLKPFVIVGTCGTTNTGSIDPLKALAEVRDDERIWLHIDGAFGASAVLGATRSAVTRGLELADSISWDAHKWLFQTYSCSLILVRNKIDLAKVYTNDGDYLRDALEHEEIPDFWNLGMELTRPSRAMKLWFTLRVLGVDRIGKMVDHGFDLAEIAEAEVRKLPDWEVISPASMAIVTFRYAPAGKTEEELDAVNAAISRHILENNIAGLLTTKVRGRVVLRICSISPVLKREELVDVIVQVGQVAKTVA